MWQTGLINAGGQALYVFALFLSLLLQCRVPAEALALASWPLSTARARCELIDYYHYQVRGPRRWSSSCSPPAHASRLITYFTLRFPSLLPFSLSPCPPRLILRSSSEPQYATDECCVCQQETELLVLRSSSEPQYAKDKCRVCQRETELLVRCLISSRRKGVPCAETPDTAIWRKLVYGKLCTLHEQMHRFRVPFDWNELPEANGPRFLRTRGRDRVEREKH